ncbi:calcium/sodium antiporter [Flammeovirga kamogawensis]|uniref:Calcium/sodium antiporter n=1 Tax=Flammeovirga kamogawensis TaxID=373891 RepID=A0ABX8H0A7_9BACT|nr:calcium/sodium antiporter [Flammeovirga kamogawensis]MBB6459558.1 cation:H+ antiporter [Flammeovirga kamogawensis]QWG09109.1 calcium/sodium antiporter [Flammeovirga kamogawensis]TRX67397.1 calcium/sodium antiporter [Flammeovirga kamogawensis]
MENKLIINILELIGGLVVLIGGGELLVKGATNMALRLKIPAIIVGLTIVAFGTSAPELFISLQSALDGNADLAIGNVVGSNICNLGMVLGITAIIYPIKVSDTTLKFDWPVAMGASVVLFLITFDSVISFDEGLVLFLLLITYLLILFKRTKSDIKLQATAEEEFQLDEEEDGNNTILTWAKDVAYIITGIIALKFGAEWFIDGAKSICLVQLELDERIVGILVLALGTSLPELVTSAVAAFKKETDLALGNLMGSNIFNILSILGITSMVTPINISDTIHNYDMVWMLGITFLTIPLMFLGKDLNRWEGALLLSVYCYYIYSIF